MDTVVHFDQMRPENRRISSHYGFHGLLGNANRRKMAVALALILKRINLETKKQTLKLLQWERGVKWDIKIRKHTYF